MVITDLVINTILEKRKVKKPNILRVCIVLRGTMLLFLVTGRMPRSGKLPVLFLLTGQKSGFPPRRGDSLHRFRSNFVWPTGTWVRLVVQNFTSIAAEGWECGPQNTKNFHFLVKSRPAGATPLADFEIFLGLWIRLLNTSDFDVWIRQRLWLWIRLTILRQCFKFHVIRFTGYGVIAEKSRVGKLGQIFPYTL